MKEVEPKSTNLVTQANKLIESRYSANKNEIRIIFIMMSFIEPSDKEFLIFKTSIPKLAEFLKVDKKSMKRELKGIVERLLSRVLEIETPNGWEMFQWISYAKANYKEDTIELRFHDRLKPYLLDLQNYFNTLKIEEFIEFDSVYSLRIYQILQEYRGLGKEEFTYSLEDFRKIVLGSRKKDQKKYPQFKYFRLKILNVAKKELDEKAELSFNFETIRVGRSIGKIKFTIVKKAKKVKKMAPPQEREEGKEVAQILLDYEVFGVMRGNLEPFLLERGEQALINTLDYFKQELASGKQIKNKGAYLFTLVKSNAGQEIEAEKKEAERKEQARLEALKKEAEERANQERLEAEKRVLRIVKANYLNSISVSEEKELLARLNEQYKAEHGVGAMEVKDIESGIISVYLNKIIRALPEYKEGLKNV